MIWILFLGSFVISLLAAARVKSNYLRFARVAASSGLTGAEAALEILRHANRSDNVAHLSCAIFSRFPTAVESPCRHRKPSKSDFFNELKTTSSQHPSVAQIFHSWKRVVFQIPPDGLASERLSVGIETKFAQGRN